MSVLTAYVWVHVACVYTMPVAARERVLEPLEQELSEIVKSHAGAGTQTLIL